MLREDPRQWLIYQEEPVTAGVKAIELMALTVAGSLLAENEHVEMRAIGNVMIRWANARQRALTGEEASSAEHAAIELVTEIINWMGGQGKRPEDALEQLHAVAFEFDSVLSGAGIKGPGWYRE